MHLPRRRSVLLASGVLCSALTLAACGGGRSVSTSSAQEPSPTAEPSSARSVPAPVPTPPTAPATTVKPANACLAQAQRMSTAQLSTQVLMIGVPATANRMPTAGLALLERGVGGVFYTSGSGAGPATAKQASEIYQGKGPLPVLVAVDQEGGQVQGLSAGFTRLPSAVVQSRQDPATLSANWATWAAELKDAGVNVDLAPVADVTPAGSGSNPPVADLERGYGATGQEVGGHVAAVLDGMNRAGVSGTLKHFPGLGRVSVNTDFGRAVDSVTTLDDANTQAFYANLPAAGMVMLSSATYAKIDPASIGAFSPAMSKALRDHGFAGPIISDDLGGAAAVAHLAPGERAISFLTAGGDLVLAVTSEAAAEMAAAVQAKADAEPDFKATLQDRAARILAYKARLGLLTCSGR